MKEPQKLWTDIVLRFADQSRCKSRKVGAILVKDDFLLGEGWNSPPKGTATDECPREKCSGKCGVPPGTDLASAICAHAEANLIGTCAKYGRATHGSILFCTTMPCLECAKLVIAAGIVEVHYIESYPSPLTELVFKNAGVTLTKLKIDEEES